MTIFFVGEKKLPRVIKAQKTHYRGRITRSLKVASERKGSLIIRGFYFAGFSHAMESRTYLSAI